MSNIIKLYQQIFGTGSMEAQEAEYFPPENLEPLKAYLRSVLNEQRYFIVTGNCLEDKRKSQLARELGVSRQCVSEMFYLAIKQLKAKPTLLRYYLLPNRDLLEMLMHLLAENSDQKHRLELQELVIKGLEDELRGEVNLATVEVEKLLELNIEKLGLSTRPRNCLSRYGIRTVRKLFDMQPDELLALKSFGHNSYDEVIEKAKELVALRPELTGKVTLLKES